MEGNYGEIIIGKFEEGKGNLFSSAESEILGWIFGKPLMKVGKDFLLEQVLR